MQICQQDIHTFTVACGLKKAAMTKEFRLYIVTNVMNKQAPRT